MWIRDDIGKLAGEILGMGQGLLDKLKAVRSLTEERPDFSRSDDVVILRAELALLRRQRRDANHEVVALNMEAITLRSEIQKLRGYVSAAQTIGGLPKKEASPYPDGRTAAAHDDTLFVSQEENDDEKTD